MTENIFNIEAYADCARRVVAESVVLLRHDPSVLPLLDDVKLAVFGRAAYNYYKSGTGSGGLVNVEYVVGILDALKQHEKIHVCEPLDQAYEAFISDHPYDMGAGWGQEPWFQAEMPVDDALLQKARELSDVALVIIGRSSGEDHDNSHTPGSYLLTEEEDTLLQRVCATFDKTIVLLNVGNIIDMSWVEKYKPSCVAYVWQGGQVGGLGVVDVLTGAVSPSGKLPDTVPLRYADCPSAPTFGNPDENCYAEDIYVGYRYYETFAPDRVLYPFGFGLSYTSFTIEHGEPNYRNSAISIPVTVRNTGSCAGKQVVQFYVQKPQGILGQPVRELVAYAKTREIQPGQSESFTISCPWDRIVSYDDGGYTGHRSCYLREPGLYRFYIGSDVRTAELAGEITVSGLEIVKQVEEIMAPVKPFRRLYPRATGEGYAPDYRDAPMRTFSPYARRVERLPYEIPYTGDQGIRLADVRDGKATLDAFIAQIGDEDLCAITRGEGMNSPKVTPGTGGAFGGVTEGLKNLGIPVACCSDGPSGIRMDCGTKAFLLPNGTALASTFNDSLVTELYRWEGMELRRNQIDMLLGPGLNIHRNPLCGRNFEYESEDPYLTGRMGIAQLKGMQHYGVTGVIKHFCCNNQEMRRNFVNALISERALREIYMRAFEMAVKEGVGDAIMTSYNPVNGIYTSSNYDLVTTVLRQEWDYKGIVMTDWWAKGNHEGQAGDSRNTAAMLRAQNDLFMVVNDAASNSGDDNTYESLQQGALTRGELQRVAKNICREIMNLPVLDRFLGIEHELDRQLAASFSEEDAALRNTVNIATEDGHYAFAPGSIGTDRGQTTQFQVQTSPRGVYELRLRALASIDNPLAQMPLSIFQDKKLLGTISLTGADTQWQDFKLPVDPAFLGTFFLRFYCGQGGMELDGVELVLVKDMEEEIEAILARVRE